MNVKSLIGSICVAGAICGAYYGGSAKSDKAMMNMSSEKDSIRTENFMLKSKLDSLQHDLVQIKKENAEMKRANILKIFPSQMDSLKRIPIGKRAPEFLERVINNASFLDSINGNDRLMYKLMSSTHTSADECLEIHLASRYGSEASHNIVKFFEHTFRKVK